MSTCLERFVIHTPLTEDTTSTDQPSGKAHPFLKSFRLNNFHNLQKLELEGAMQILVFRQNGLSDPPFGLVCGIDVFCLNLNQETPFIA